MKKAIILLSIFLFLVSFVSAVDFTDDIVGYFNMSSVTNNYDASGRNNNGSLVSVDSCSGSLVGSGYNFSSAGDAHAKTFINDSEFSNAALSVSYLVKFVPADISSISAY